MNKFKIAVARLLRLFGLEIGRIQNWKSMEALSRDGLLFRFLKESPRTSGISIDQASHLIESSKSQLGQDVIALSLKGLGEPGFFVEFGATDGVVLSNTHLLEKHYGWKGILCEPAGKWHAALEQNRDCTLDTRCVFSESGKSVSFSETSLGALSTITSFLDSDHHRSSRKKHYISYEVKTVSLIDLLAEHNAPEFIDFLSIDTEGSELEILESFDFGKHEFGFICVEHNYTANREKLKTLLESNGYSRIYSEYSEFDDWYIRSLGRRTGQ